MLKNIFKIIVIFIFGMAGGIFAEQIFWPYFVERPLFYQYGLERSPIYVTETKEVFIQENVALQNAVEKVEKAIVGIETKLSTGKIVKGSGLVITSDGLMVTLSELVPRGSSPVFFVDGTLLAYQILKRDLEKNLVLIKLEEKNLLTLGFADFDKIRSGQRVFLVGKIKEKNELQKIVNEGIIRNFNDDYIQTTISEEISLKGSPLFDTEGQVLGLNLINSKGNIQAIPIKEIRSFTGF